MCEMLANRNPDSVKNEVYNFEKDTYLLINGKYVRLKSIGGCFGYSVSRMTHRIDAEDFVGYVLKDVVSGKTEIFDKQKQLNSCLLSYII